MFYHFIYFILQRYLKRASGDYVIGIDWTESDSIDVDPNFNPAMAHLQANSITYELRGKCLFASRSQFETIT